MSARVLLFVAAAGASACSGRFVYDDADAGDASLDGGDAPSDVEADTHEVLVGVPPAGTYRPTNGGRCPFSTCGPNAICDELTGFCCGGRWVDDACKCGDDDGCTPPSVCCPAAGGPEGAGACVARVDLCPGAH